MWSVKRLLILLFSRRKFWQKELHNIFKSNLRTDITFQDARYKIYHNVRWIITCHNCQTQEVLRIWDAPRRVARQDRYGQPTLPEETSVRSVSPEIKETIMCKVWNETIPANGVLRKFAWKTKSDFYEMVPFQVIQIWDYIAFYRTKIVIWTISWLVKIFFKMYSHQRLWWVYRWNRWPVECRRNWAVHRESHLGELCPREKSTRPRESNNLKIIVRITRLFWQISLEFLWVTYIFYLVFQIKHYFSII